MRKALTDAELKLWNALRGHRLMGLGFRRQMPILGYITDFACPAHKLVVELDGSQHAEGALAEQDSERDVRLRQAGWTVLRFWNDDVLRDLDNVCLHILSVIRDDGRQLPAPQEQIVRLFRDAEGQVVEIPDGYLPAVEYVSVSREGENLVIQPLSEEQLAEFRSRQANAEEPTP